MLKDLRILQKKVIALSILKFVVLILQVGRLTILTDFEEYNKIPQIRTTEIIPFVNDRSIIFQTVKQDK